MEARGPYLIRMSFIDDLLAHRADPSASTWTLPAWGHPASQGVLPLFMSVDRRLKPIGSAYWVGGKAPFVMTALHCIMEALRHEPRFERLLASGQLPQTLALREVGFYVQTQDAFDGDSGRATLLPLQSVQAGPPGDVAFGFPQFQARSRWAPPISFDPPRIGSTVWSLGYIESAPQEGFVFEDLKTRDLDWRRDYGHRFVVTEARVTHIFTQRFAHGYNGGPCFAFDADIAHGQSGGPILSEDGRVVGLNSCSAASFFNAPAALGAMFYPMLLNPLTFAATLGSPGASVTLQRTAPLIDMVSHGAILSDGSERHVGVHEVDEGLAIGPRIPREDTPFVHDDFSGFQAGRPAEKLTEFHRFVVQDAKGADGDA